MISELLEKRAEKDGAAAIAVERLKQGEEEVSRGTRTLRPIHPAITRVKNGLEVGDFVTALENSR